MMYDTRNRWLVKGCKQPTTYDKGMMYDTRNCPDSMLRLLCQRNRHTKFLITHVIQADLTNKSWLMPVYMLHDMLK